jgi:hypothetical protein
LRRHARAARHLLVLLVRATPLKLSAICHPPQRVAPTVQRVFTLVGAPGAAPRAWDGL